MARARRRLTGAPTRASAAAPDAERARPARHRASRDRSRPDRAAAHRPGGSGRASRASTPSAPAIAAMVRPAFGLSVRRPSRRSTRAAPAADCPREPRARDERGGGQPRRHVVGDVVGARGGAAEILELVPPVADHGVGGVHRAIGPRQRQAARDTAQARARHVEAERRDDAVGEVLGEGLDRGGGDRALVERRSVSRLTRCQATWRRAPSRSPADQVPAHDLDGGEEPAQREAALEQPRLGERRGRAGQLAQEGLRDQRRARREAGHDQDEEGAVERQVVRSARRPRAGERDEPADPRHRMPAIGRIPDEEIQRHRESQQRHRLTATISSSQLVDERDPDQQGPARQRLRERHGRRGGGRSRPPRRRGAPCEEERATWTSRTRPVASSHTCSSTVPPSPWRRAASG